MARKALDLTGYSVEGYVFKKLLGMGGFGRVWLCEQPALERHVAVKVLMREGRFAEARFLREARLASKLDHPNAAHVYGFGVDATRNFVWIAMEYVPGMTLDKWLAQHRRMSPEQLVPFVRTLAEVVQAAHNEGIVHRDLKPSNVMVVERGGRLIPKLLDLGIARDGVHPETLVDECSEEAEPHPEDRAAIEALVEAAPVSVIAGGAPASLIAVVGASTGSTADAAPSARPPYGAETHRGIGADVVRRLTPVGAFHLGTQHYMAPEQWSNPAEVGPAADLYALGVIVFRCFAGRVPFDADDARELQMMHMVRPVPSLGAEFSPEIDAVVARALAKDPSDRYATVVEFAEELEAAIRRLPRQQLASLAQAWDDAGRPRSLVLAEGDLLRTEGRNELERAFLSASHEHVARGVHRRLVLQTLAATCLTAIGAVSVGSYLMLRAERAERKVRVAEAVTETTITQAALEQGRAELLHGEPAAKHLAKAYQRDPKPTTAFMLARALQPLLAERTRLISSSGQMWSAAFSPDGTRAVTSDEKTAQIWDVQTSRVVLTLPHKDVVYQAVFSSDGSKIFTASGDGAVRIWVSATGRLIRELRPSGRTVRYYALAIAPDGRLIAAIDFVGAVAHVWDVGSGALLAELRNDSNAFPSVAFSADGRWLATSGGGEARVFDVQTWAKVASIPAVRCMSWDPTGSRLIAGSVAGDVSIWELPSGKRVRHHELGEAVTAVAYAPDGQLFVTASRDGTEKVWEAKSFTLLNQGNYLHGSIRAVEFDRGSRLMVAAGYGGSVAIVDAKEGLPISVLEGPRNLIASAHFDLTSQRVIAASWDGTARIWDTAPPYRQWSSPVVANGCGIITDLEPMRRFVAVGCDNLSTRVWDSVRGQLLGELPSIVPSGDDFAGALPALTMEGNRAGIARGSHVELYELPGGRLVRRVEHDALVNAVAFATGGQDLASGAVDGSLLVTRGNGTQVSLPKAEAGIDVVSLLSDGRLIAADAQRHLLIYDVRGALMAQLETSARVTALRVSGDNKQLITLPRRVGKLASPELWDLEHNRLITALDDEGQGYVRNARFVAGGKIVTASLDGAARLWDRAGGKLLQTYRGGTRFLSEAVVSPDGTMVVGGDADGIVRFWDAGSGNPLWVLQAHRSAVIGIYFEDEDILTRGYSGDIARWHLPSSQHTIEACHNNKQCGRVLL